MIIIDFIGAFIRWLFKGCKNNLFKDELFAENNETTIIKWRIIFALIIFVPTIITNCYGH